MDWAGLGIKLRSAPPWIFNRGLMAKYYLLHLTVITKCNGIRCDSSSMSIIRGFTDYCYQICIHMKGNKFNYLCSFKLEVTYRYRWYLVDKFHHCWDSRLPQLQLLSRAYQIINTNYSISKNVNEYWQLTNSFIASVNYHKKQINSYRLQK